MDRQITYPGQLLTESSLLQATKDAMIGCAKLSSAVLGTGTVANGFTVTPTGPASLQVLCAPGEIYSMTAIDAAAFSSLPADTTHSILKQGILLDGVTLSCPAPGTTGQSINYLVQATYQDSDMVPVLLPYYNSTNPALPFSGMGNNGLPQNTIRKGVAVVAVKAGASATTGSQATPAPDSGYVGLYVVTVAFGQTTITTTSIALYSAAPLLPAGIVPAVQSNAMTYAKDFGAAGVYKATYFPAITALTDGMVLEFEVLTANPGSATFSPNGIAPSPIVGGAHSPLQGGEFIVGGKAEVMWHATLSSWVLLGCTGGAQQVGPATKSQHAMQFGQAVGRLINVQTFATAGTFTYTPTAGTNSIVVEVQGAGGAGGGTQATNSTQIAIGGGGGAGAFSRSRLTTGFSGAVVTVGVPGTASAGAAGGAGGSSAFGAAISCPGGFGGQLGGASNNSSSTLVQATARSLVSTGGNLLNISGQPSVCGLYIVGVAPISGAGAGGPYGCGGNAATYLAGQSANGGGAGGGGACANTSSAALAGGAAGAGIVTIWEYA